MRQIAVLGCFFALAACGGTSSNKDGGADAGCVDNVNCKQGTHWDTAACMCVADEACTATSCEGGTKGCSSMCPSGCPGGQLCCPWSGGACQLTDAGTCANNGGFSCAMPTNSGVCPNRCYP